MLNIYIVGCGGIGGFVLNLLPQAIASLSVDSCKDYWHNDGRSVTADRIPDRVISLKGDALMCCIADRLVLIDGDSFDGHNTLRQAAGAGSKLAVQMRRMKESQLCTTWLRPMMIQGFNSYVTPRNVSNIIPVDRSKIPDNKDNEAMPGYLALTKSMEARGIAPDMPVVFLCVDNHKTRYEISKYMECFQDCLVINGGNEKTTGNVTVYERRKGVALDPEIYKLYPEINGTADKRPDEIGCGEVSSKNDQTAIVNSVIASIMLGLFAKWVRQGNFDHPTRSGGFIRKNEVIISLDDFKMSALANTTVAEVQPTTQAEMPVTETQMSKEVTT